MSNHVLLFSCTQKNTLLRALHLLPLKVLFSLCFTGLIAACTPPLERPAVPLLAGIRIPDGCSDAVMEENIRAYQDWGFEGWVIGISLDPGGHFLTDIDSIFPVELRNHLPQQPYSLALELEAPLAAHSANKPTSESLAALLPLFEQIELSPPQRLIFMGEFVHSAAARAAVGAFLPELKRHFPSFQGDIVFAAAPAWLDESFDWKTPDLIGIRHQAPPDLDYRPWFRETHQRLSRLLIDHQKPALIVESNLIGEEALLLFRNELRFWNDSVDLRGIVINTLYCRMALTDTSSYFGLGRDVKLQRYLQEYTK